VGTTIKNNDHSHTEQDATYLKIGDVSKMVGISATVIRQWERLGLIRPLRTDSKYRLYSTDDVRLLKRARFLRKDRGLNAPAIVDLLVRGGEIPFETRPAPTNGHRLGLGAQLRHARTQLNLSLSEAASAIGISTGFLSSLERSQTSASVGTLRKLARFYKINVLDLFQPSETNPYLVRPKDRKKLNAGRGVEMELLAWGNTMMEPHLFRIAPNRGSGESYSHHGEEFLHVIRGELQISIAGKPYRLRAGDSLYFDSNTPHEWHNPGKRETLVLWINTPPTF
jgi:DNA-binding transcriptional MerR regulator/mannose-6-phosphate isomerase-like protein (cupin superfamily)